MQTYTKQVLTANKSAVKIIGRVTLLIQLQLRLPEVEQEFVLTADEGIECLLGNDFLKTNKFVLNLTNEEVLARSRMSTLSAMIMIKRLKWFGHILGMNDDRLALQAFTWEPTEKYRYAKRAPGGQRKTWMDQLEEDCSRNNMSYITLRQKAKRYSKSRFNSFVEQHFLD